jgi:hypothetical protein
MKFSFEEYKQRIIKQIMDDTADTTTDSGVGITGQLVIYRRKFKVRRMDNGLDLPKYRSASAFRPIQD